MTNFLAHLTSNCRASYQYIKRHIWLDNLIRTDIVLLIMLIGYNLTGRLFEWYSIGFGRMMVVVTLMDMFLLFERVLDYFGGNN